MKHNVKHAEYTKQWRIDNKEHVRQYELDNKEKRKENRLRYNLNKKYGITLEEYNEMFIKQEGKCAICGQDRNNFKTEFSVDHTDHKTNKIRGLLCKNCNFILGHANDNVEILQNAINYITI